MSTRKILGGAEFRKEFESTLNSAQKSGILGFDPTDRAPNAIEWIIRREFLNSPRILNHWGQFQLVRDFFELLCPVCAKESDVQCWGKSKESLTSQPLLVWSKSWEEDQCPRCRRTRSELEEMGDNGELPNMALKFNRYNQLHGVIGMRCVPLKKIISTLNGLSIIGDLLTEEHYKNPGVGIPMDTHSVRTKDGISGITHLAYMGKKPMRVTKFKSGFMDKVSVEHKYRVMDAGMNFYWKEAKDLKKGDVVVRRLGTRSYGPESIDSKFAYCIGVLANSGYLERFNRINFKITKQQDNDLFVDKVVDIFKDVFGETRVSLRVSKDATLVEISGREAIDRVLKFGLNLKFRENISEFPSHIYSYDKKTQSNFLKGFFDVGKEYCLKTPYKSENNYLKRKKAKVSIEVLNENQGKYKWPEVRFFCKNEEINRNIFIMMFNAGLLLTKNISEIKMQTTVSKSAGWMYLSPAHIKRFVDEIGSLDDKFVSQCRYWHKLTSGPYRYIHHNFPLRLRKETGKFLKDFINQFKGKNDTHRLVDHIHLNYKKTLHWFDWVYWLTQKGTIHPEFLLHGIDHLPSKEFPAKLSEFLQEGNFYDMVMSTSDAPPEEVAEIRVAEHHSYIGDTFVYHNSGKSDVMGQIATYIEHDCLATAHDQGLMRYLGLPDDEYVDMSFVASSQDQADETVWAKYRNKRANSPWFQKYVPWVKHQEAVQSTPMGMRKWRYIETESSITNEHPKVHIRINSWSTNSDSLVGKTRIGGVVDEMGRMKNTEGAGSAQEVYGGLESSCATVRGRAQSRNLRNWLGFMLSMTSPKKSSGLEMQLLRVGQDIERMMTIHKATWEFNPLQPYSSLKDEFKKNPVKAWRDFGARPIDSEYPLIVDPKEFIKKTVAPQLKPTCKFEIFTEQEGPHRYTSARCTHAELDPNMQHFIAVDAGKNWDAFSMASAHPEYEENVDGSTKVLTVFDWILRIVPVEGTEVKFEFVEDVFKKLLQFQIIEMVRFDHWNSAHLIQKIRNMGVPDAMEENIKHEDYSKFVQDAKEGKVRMLPIPKADLNNQNQRTMTPEKIAFVELLELEKDPDTEKVFNPDKGKMRGWHCGLEGTEITKEFGLRCPIEQVNVGDKIIDKNGNTQIVEDHWCEGIPDKIVEIKTWGNRKLEFTDNHHFPAFIWSRECQSGSGNPVNPGKLYASGHNGGRGNGTGGKVIIPSKLGNKHSLRIPDNYEPIKKVRADKLREKDYLLMPRKFEEITPNVSVDYAYLLGIYVAEGWIYNPSSSIQFGFHKNEDETLAEDTRLLLKKIGDLDTSTSYSKKCNGITVFTVNDQGKKDSRSLINWLINNGGQYSNHKILSEEVMKWPLEYKKQFIKGLFRGDGCQTLSKKDGHLRYRISLDLTSKNIIDQVELILTQLGIASERCDVDLSHKNKNTSYRLRIGTPHYAKKLGEMIWGDKSIYPSDKDDSLHKWQPFYDDNYLYIPIKSIKIINNDKPVYNMTVSGDHSYLAEGLGTYNSNDTASVIVGCHKMVQTAFYVKDPFVRSNRNKRKAALAKRTVTPGMPLSSVYTPEK